LLWYVDSEGANGLQIVAEAVQYTRGVGAC
jgi:hypothetical protein